MRHRKILLLLMIVGVVGCEDREAVRRREAVNSLKQLGLALHAYNANHPPDGEEGESASPVESQTTTEPEGKRAEADETKSGLPE